MSFSSIIMAAIAIIGAIIGGLFGHRIGKSSGVSEGAKKQVEVQQVEQARAVVQAVQERSHADKVVAADGDVELDARLSKYDRKG